MTKVVTVGHVLHLFVYHAISFRLESFNERIFSVIIEIFVFFERRMTNCLVVWRISICR